jgi:hypothetical protein
MSDEQNETEVLNHVEANIKIFNEAVEEAIPVMKEINDIKRDIAKDVNTCIKYGFDRSAGEFNSAVRLIHDFESCMESEESKLHKMILNMKKVVEYYDAFGKSDVINKIANDVGIDMSLLVDAVDTLGSDQMQNRDKVQEAYSAQFGKEIPEDRIEMLNNLMNLSVDTRGEIVDKTNEVKEDLSEPICDTGISKSTFVRAVNLKIRSENKDDVPDKINSITEGALLQAEALQSILND